MPPEVSLVQSSKAKFIPGMHFLMLKTPEVLWQNLRATA